MNITWFGHSNFLLSIDSTSVLIDPFFTGNPALPTAVDVWQECAIDVVLVTHDHGDHVGDAITICKTKQAMCGCVVGTDAKLVEKGLPTSLLPVGMGFNIGGTWEYKGLKITMTEAFHSSDSGVPVGYIITLPGGFTVYHAGDTGVFANMFVLGDLYPIDLALLPIGGFFTMDGIQAARACKLLQPKMVIPMHYKTFPMLAQDTAEFAKNLSLVAPKTKLLHLQPGQTLNL